MRRTIIIAGIGAMLAAAPVSAQTGARPLRPEADSEAIQAAAAVIKITELRRQGNATVKLFGTAAGDPAMNGLYTYIAFWQSTGDGWRVFKIGDFLDYALVSEAPGRVVLQLRESTMDRATGNIGARTRRIAVAWTPVADGAPATVRVTAAP